MTLMTRRAFVTLPALATGPRKRRHRMGMQPDQQGVFFQLIIQGGGEFTYDAAGNLRTANVGQTTTDPIQGITCYAGFSTFNGHGAVISLFSSTLDAQLWYTDTGSSTQGALTASVSSQGGTDPFGNVFSPVVASYSASATTGKIVQLNGAELLFANNAAISENAITGPAAQPSMVLAGPQPFGGDNAAVLSLLAESSDTTKPAQVLIQSIVVGGTPAGPTTKALLEVAGDVQFGDGMSIGQGLPVRTLINGSTITTAGVTMQPVTAAASVTGLILQAGTFDGQVMSVPSDAAAGITGTFAAAATSNVKLGTGAVLQPGRTHIFHWVASTSRWYMALTA